jgi:hypothetical protein
MPKINVCLTRNDIVFIKKINCGLSPGRIVAAILRAGRHLSFDIEGIKCEKDLKYRIEKCITRKTESDTKLR